ncbi:MAG: hypothetical protein HN350_19935, partial [Phycisphaerales bacterium]|nr:hypothetical protein [Phycisphaerales bacterium]
GSPQLKYAAGKLAKALKETGGKCELLDLAKSPKKIDIAIIVGQADVKFLKPLLAEEIIDKSHLGEGFRIRRIPTPSGKVLCVTASDASGAMYGALDLAEQIRTVGLAKVADRAVNPRFAFRAIKFNLPWMSYRKSEALSLHTETCRDLAFWREFLDMMAANRFNALTLWNLHPYTFMIRPKNFPEACGFSDKELAQWQTFWRGLFRMAAERGIATYIVNWNIFVSPEMARKRGVAAYSKDWSYFGSGDTSDLVKRYTRECVTQVINEYDDLTGIGVSLGERMGGMTPQQREDWIVEAVVAGIKKAKRPARFIHRAPFSAGRGSGGSTDTTTEKLTRKAIETLGFTSPVWVEVKFNWSHGHSSPRLCIVHGGKVSDAYWKPAPKNYKMAWMIRNEDFFILRWGQGDFIRKHIANNGHDYVGGYFIGSECYIPAKDYFQKPDKRINWRYAFQRQWLYYMLWGRLLYDPKTPDSIFTAEFDRRYGPDVGGPMLKAYALASKMPLRLASFYGATWDFTLYSEGFLAAAGSGGKFDRSSPFISIDELIDHKTLDPTYMSIPDYVSVIRKRKPIAPERLTPLELADALETDSRTALKLTRTVASNPNCKPGPLDFEIDDVRTWSYLGLYFAEKLRAGVALETFRRTKAVAQRAAAVKHLETAAVHWASVVKLTSSHYNNVPLVHIGKRKFSWESFTRDVRRDIQTARNAK